MYVIQQQLDKIIVYVGQRWSAIARSLGVCSSCVSQLCNKKISADENQTKMERALARSPPSILAMLQVRSFHDIKVGIVGEDVFAFGEMKRGERKRGVFWRRNSVFVWIGWMNGSEERRELRSVLWRMVLECVTA